MTRRTPRPERRLARVFESVCGRAVRLGHRRRFPLQASPGQTHSARKRLARQYFMAYLGREERREDDPPSGCSLTRRMYLRQFHDCTTNGMRPDNMDGELWAEARQRYGLSVPGGTAGERQVPAPGGAA